MSMRMFLMLFLLCGPAAAAPVVLVFGDSLSAAYGIAREAGWVSLLEKRAPGYQVVNASVSGETSAGGLTRLPGVLAAHRPAVVVLELGANDGLRGLPVEAARSNLTKMIDLAKQRGGKVLLLGMRMPQNYGAAYTARFERMYAELAVAKKVRLLPFFLDGLKLPDFQADGLHPNASAQARLMENVWRELKPML